MCTKCQENAEPIPYVDTPIFWSLVDERRKAGQYLPWHRMWKPSGTVGLLDSHSTGIYPEFSISIKRDRLGPINPIAEYWAHERAGMEVVKVHDYVKLMDPS